MLEWVKLVLILGGGILIMGIGLTIQIKKKRKVEKDPSNYASSLPTSEEEKAERYVKTYMASFPRSSIKAGLVNMNISEDRAEIYLNRYM